MTLEFEGGNASSKPVMARFMRAIHVFLDPTRHPPLDSHGTEDGAKAMGLPHAFVELIFDLMDDIARIGNWLRKNPIAGLGALFLIVFLGLFAQRWFAGSEIFSAEFWEGDPEGIRNLIWALATLFAGAAGLYGLLLAGRRTAALDRQAQVAHDHRVLAEQGQITERFTKAVEQLGHEEVAVRLGAIYALERVAKDSERDFTTIMETLAAFARQRASQDATSSLEDALRDLQVRPAIDVAAAISILARIIPNGSAMRNGMLQQRTDLRNLDLRGLDLPGANLSGFRLDGCSLTWANLYGANCEGTSFRSANLSLVEFDESTLPSADFSLATLYRAGLRRADLSGAKFWRANLHSLRADHANFSGGDLYSANLEQALLWRARLCDVNLMRASLKDTVLDSADLGGADLSYSSFEGTFVSETVFAGVKGLEADQLSNVRYEQGKAPVGLEAGLLFALPVPMDEDDEIPF